MPRLAALLPAAVLALAAGAASAEDCAPLVAAYMNRAVPFAATFVTSGGFQKGPPAASHHVWTGKDWYFWLDGTGWFSLHDRHTEPAGPMPPVLVCENLGEAMLNGQAVVLHTLRAQSPDYWSDDQVWIARPSGLLVKSVHRTPGGRVFTMTLDYDHVPLLSD